MGRVVQTIGWSAVAIAMILAVQGCTFVDLNRDQKEIDRAGWVKLRVEGERFAEHPVYAALVREPGDSMMAVTVETYGVVPGSQKIELRAPEGNYLVVAFQDINENKKYNESEPFAAYGQPEPVELWAGRVIEDLTLSLDVAVMPDLWTPKALQERGVEVSERLANFGKLISLDDPRFEREVARTGMWQPAHFIHGNNAGMYILEEYDPGKTPVVFVHGIGGSPRHFTTIIEQIDHERFQPWVFYYPSAMRLQELGDYLQVCLDRMRAEYGYKNVAIVSHSMGGLVSWAGVRAHLKQNPTPYIDFFVTIHSPLGGMSSAAAGVDHAPVVMNCWIDLDPRSEFIATVYEEPLPSSIPYHLFYGVVEGQEVSLPVPKDTLDAELAKVDPSAFNDETVSLDSQLQRSAVAQTTSLHSNYATHMGTLRDPQTIETLNSLLAEYADNRPAE